MDTSKEKRYNYFYRIDNKVNGRFYVGIHSTNNLNDGYMGSGEAIKDAIKKYGGEQFEKTILQYFPTRVEAANYEREFITPEFLEENKGICYNIALGGCGGAIQSEDGLRRMSEKNKGGVGPNKGKQFSEEWRRNISESLKGHPGWNKGKKHSPESKKKMAGFKGRKHSPETIAKMKGRHRSEEQKRQHSEFMKRYWANKKKQLTA